MFDFAKNKEVETLDGVPENIKPFYVRKDTEDDASPFVLKPGDAVVSAAVAMITSQQTIVTKERKIAKDAKAEAVAAKEAGSIDLGPLSAYGTDVAGIVTGVAKQKTDLESQIKDGASVKTQIETLKREMSEAHGKTVGEKDVEIANLTGQLDTYMLNTEIAAAASAHAGLNPKIIAPFAMQRMKVEVAEDEKTRRVVILDGDGSVKFSMDRPGERANAAELLEEMSKDATYETLFPSAARSGSGAQRNSSLPGQKSGKDMSPAQKIAAGLQKQQHG